MNPQAHPAAVPISRAHTTSVPADKGIRAAGYLIDVLPGIVIGLFGFIPIIGPMIAGFLLAPYWLLRDVTGASLGKLVLKTKVVRKDLQPASVGARVLRNLPLAIGPAFLIIPLLGYFLGPSITGVIVLIETIFVLTQGERVGDRIAGTTVEGGSCVLLTKKPADILAHLVLPERPVVAALRPPVVQMVRDALA